MHVKPLDLTLGHMHHAFPKSRYCSTSYACVRSVCAASLRGIHSFSHRYHPPPPYTLTPPPPPHTQVSTSQSQRMTAPWGQPSFAIVPLTTWRPQYEWSLDTRESALPAYFAFVHHQAVAMASTIYNPFRLTSYLSTPSTDRRFFMMALSSFVCPGLRNCDTLNYKTVFSTRFSRF